MASTVFLRLSKLMDFLNMVNSLKAIQTSKLLLILKEEGAFMLASNVSRSILAEAFMRNIEFDIYRLIKDIEISIDFQVFRTILKSLVTSSNSATITMEYPCKDNKFLILCEDESYTSQFYLDTYANEPQYSLDLNGEITATAKFLDSKIIKQAMEVACHCKSDSEIFLTFSTHKPILYFTRDDPVTFVKSKITIPCAEEIDCKVSKNCERTYPAKVLKGIANFPKCRDIELKMHEEGILEIEVSVSADTLVRHFINPCDN